MPWKTTAEVLPSNGNFAGGHLIKNGPHGEQVAARIQIFSASLLGRHVSDGADRRTWRSELQRREGRGIATHGLQCRAAFVNQFRQPEIEDLGLPARSDEDVARLQIAVHDAFVVSNLERVADLDANVDDLVERQRAPFDLLVQALAFQQLHGDEVLAVAFLDGIDGADVGVVERRGGARLLLEALQGVGVLLEIPGKKLKGDVTPEPGVLSFIHHAHAAGAQFFHDGVVKKALPDQGFQSQDSQVFDSIVRREGRQGRADRVSAENYLSDPDFPPGASGRDSLVIGERFESRSSNST